MSSRLVDADIHCRSEVRLSQTPSSMNLGTTVWDASICLAKYLEKVSRKSALPASLSCRLETLYLLHLLPAGSLRGCVPGIEGQACHSVLEEG